jgi:hypothetical protein
VIRGLFHWDVLDWRRESATFVVKEATVMSPRAFVLLILGVISAAAVTLGAGYLLRGGVSEGAAIIVLLVAALALQIAARRA